MFASRFIPTFALKNWDLNSIEHVHESCPELIEIAILLERGQISSEEFLEKLQTSVVEDLTIVQSKDAWNKLIGDEIPRMDEVIEELFEANLTPIFFSNISDIHFEFVCEKLTFAHRITTSILSYQIGEIKPNPRNLRSFRRPNM